MMKGKGGGFETGPNKIGGGGGGGGGGGCKKIVLLPKKGKNCRA